MITIDFLPLLYLIQIVRDLGRRWHDGQEARTAHAFSLIPYQSSQDSLACDRNPIKSILDKKEVLLASGWLPVQLEALDKQDHRIFLEHSCRSLYCFESSVSNRRLCFSLVGGMKPGYCVCPLYLILKSFQNFICGHNVFLLYPSLSL